MSRQNKRRQKTNDDYRRDIFSLKSKIRQEQQYLEEIKQKCSEVDIFGQQSYTFQMKLKILECDLAGVKQKIFKYSKDEYSYFYQLNFCVFAFSRACTIIGISPQMVFRAVNIANQKFVKRLDLQNFMREVLRLDSVLFNSILNELHSSQTTEITQNRYLKLISCFMIDTEKSEKQTNFIGQSINTICRQLLKMQTHPKLIWDTKLLNIATTAGGLKKKIKAADTLDCIAVYCRCDPTKQGAVQSDKIIQFLQTKMEDIKNSKIFGLKLKE